MGKKKKKLKSKITNNAHTNGNEPSDIQENQMQQQKYTVEDLLERVTEFLENFEFELALKFCEKALSIEPNNVNVLETSGNVCAEMGDIENAKHYFLQAVQLQPDKGHVKYLYLGQISQGSEAVQYYERAIKVMTDCIEFHENNMQEVNETNMQAENEKSLTKKDISSVYCSLAELYMTDCCMEENAEEICEKYCKQAVELDGDNFDAYLSMCNFLLSKDDVETAKTNVDKAFEIWTKASETYQDNIAEIVNYESRITLIKILIEVECYEKVSVIVDQLIEENEDDIRIWYYLGLAKSLSKSTDNPRFYLEKALELYEKLAYEDESMKAHIEELLEPCPLEERMETLLEEGEEGSEDCVDTEMVEE